MLILTRKRDDSIKIGEDIVVRVMRTARGSVKIGIEAPASVRIVRGELNEFEEFAASDAVNDPCQQAVKLSGLTTKQPQTKEVASDESSDADLDLDDEVDLHDEYLLDEMHGLGHDLDLELDMELAMVMQH